MSLAVLADHLASRGRGEDTMLVHMTPGEVKGLQALALAHGGSLTINPETGLVEAGFLKSLLPAIAGFALAPLTAGTSLAFLGATPLASALTVGGAMGLATGSLKQGIMAGLGAYGGASLGAGLTQAGMAGIQAEAGASAAQSLAAADAAAAQGMAYPVSAEATKALQQQVLAKAAATTPFEAMKAGLTGLGSEAGRQNLMASFGSATGAGGLSNLARAGMMAASPVIADQMVQTATPMPTGGGFSYTPRARSMAFDPRRPYELEQLPVVDLTKRPPGMNSGGIVALADGGALKPAEYVAKQALGKEEFGPLGTLSAQQQQELALGEARKGLAAGLSASQIADVVNAKYNKGFTEQNVRDFMLANELISAPPATGGVSTPGGVVTPATPTPATTAPATTAPTAPAVTAPGGTAPAATTPAPVTYGKPFTPDVPTMETVRSGYVQGGGNIEMPTIGTVAPGERIYTQNRVYQALTDYLASNPNAIYGDVAKLAKELGVPQQQLKAAVNEYRFNNLTGSSKSSYDYLMGRGPYQVGPTLPAGTPIMKPYYEAVGYTPPSAQGEFFSGRKIIPTPTGDSVSSDTGLVTWKNTQTGEVVKDLASKYVDDPTWVRVSDAADTVKTAPASVRGTGNLMVDAIGMGSADPNKTITPFKGGGITALADGGQPGVTYGKSFEEAAGISPTIGGMPTQFDELVKRYAAAAPAPVFVPAPAPAAVPAPAPAAVAAPAPAAQAARNTALEAILNRPRPTVQQEIASRYVPPKDAGQPRTAYEQNLASQMKPEEFKAMQESPYSVLSPEFNAAVAANIQGQRELQRQGIPSVFGSTFEGGAEAVSPWLRALEIERPMGGNLVGGTDLDELLSEYMNSALVGDTSRARGAYARMNTLGLSSNSINNMAQALDPEFQDKLYNMNFDPATKTFKGPTSYQGFESYFAPLSGGSGWAMIAREKARQGLKDEDIAYGLGLSLEEVQRALANVPPDSGMARGGLADVAAMSAARGGNVEQYNLGGYSDGGRLLRGPGDGVSDSIPATIGGKQPARLADGEFVIPARIVSEIGNGSTEAGARKLYAMMDRVQRARAKTTGKGKVAKNTRADKYLPA